MDAGNVGARILVVDDDQNICRALEFALTSQGYEVRAVHSGEHALRGVETWMPDLIVLDVKLPDTDGLTTLGHLREDERFNTVPVIFLTATRTDPASKVEGLRLGANDYMVKPFSLDELLARVSANLRVTRLTQRLEEMTSCLTDLASRDSLTGLYHHGKIVERLSAEAYRAARQGTGISCIMLDLDKFKRVNDTFGHQAGDEVIIHIGRLLLTRCRKTDSVGRYGGDEFLCVLPEASPDGAHAKAEDLRSRLSELPVPSLPRTFSLSASFGVSSARCPADFDASTLVQCADQALYQAKAAGGNQVVVWMP